MDIKRASVPHTCDYCGATCEEPYDSEPEALLASDEHECETET